MIFTSDSLRCNQTAFVTFEPEFQLHMTCVHAVGAIAGAATGVATTPLDVIKTRLMTQGNKGTYKGVIDCAQKVAQQEGTAAFFKVCSGV